jgi:tyrosyl-tRNA synthetase
VDRFHGADAGVAAEEAFDRVHRHHEVPDEMPSVDWPASEPVVHLPALLARAFGISTSEARRVLTQGGVRIDGRVIDGGALDLDAAEVDGRVVQFGKRRFARVRVT